MKNKRVIVASSLAICAIIIICVGVFFFLKKDKNSSPLECVIDKQEHTVFKFAYTIYGHCVNESSKQYDDAKIFFKCYDKEENLIGEAKGNTKLTLNKIKPGDTWEYAAMYTDDKVEDIDHCVYDRVEVVEHKEK